MDAETVILQHRGPWRDIPTDDVRFEYLHDLSGGEGRESIGDWPDPPRHRRAGYAGWLGPHNIVRALEFAERHPSASIWLDMQSGVRNGDNLMAPGMIELVCRTAFGEGEGMRAIRANGSSKMVVRDGKVIFQEQHAGGRWDVISVPLEEPAYAAKGGRGYPGPGR